MDEKGKLEKWIASVERCIKIMEATVAEQADETKRLEYDRVHAAIFMYRELLQEGNRLSLHLVP